MPKAKAADIEGTPFGVYVTDESGQKAILYTRTLNHPIEKVWQAIAEEEHRATWFPELKLEHRVGGDAVVDFSGSGCPPPEENPSDYYSCTVTRFDPPHVLEYIGPGEHHRFELTAQGSGCVLTFLALLPGTGEFDDSGQIESRYSVACGWHYKLDAMEQGLDGAAFEDEGYAGPVKTEYYFVYRKLDRKTQSD